MLTKLFFFAADSDVQENTGASPDVSKEEEMRQELAKVK